MPETDVVDTGEVEQTEQPDEQITEETTEESGQEGSEEVDLGDVEDQVEQEEQTQDEPVNYKEVFKAHPELRKAFFENNQYKTVFATPEDAQDAYERVQTLEDFETSIREGDINPVINAIIESNSQAFGVFAENFLGNLQQMDSRLYDRALAPHVANLFRAMMEAGKRNGNKNLFLAGQHASDWVFGNAVPPNLKPTPETVPNRQSNERQHHEFYKELESEVSVFLNSEALRGLDPNNVLPANLKTMAAKDLVQDAIGILKKNGQAQRQLQILRDKAARAGFSYESRKALRDAYQTLIKPIIAQRKGAKRDEIMKSIGKDALGNKVQKKLIPAGSGSGLNKKNIDPKKIDSTRTSMLDVLNGKVTMKGDK